MALTHMLLMRHAKSSWDDPALDDHDRPLNARGRRDCERIAAELHARGIAPDTIWASSAERTQETALRLMRALPGPQTVVNAPGFYHAGADDVRHILAGAEEPDGKLMLLGHNPGWQSLALELGGEPLPMPTAAVAVLARKSLDEPSWSPLAWRLHSHITPKSLHAH